MGRGRRDYVRRVGAVHGRSLAVVAERGVARGLFARLLADFEASELQRFGDCLDRIMQAFKAQA